MDRIKFRRVLRQDGAGGARARGEEEKRREEQFAKEEEEYSRKKAVEMMKSAPKFREALRKMIEEEEREMLIREQEGRGLFRTPTLETKITLMIRSSEASVEEGLKRAQEVKEHLAWQESVISKLERTPKGKEILQKLREMAKTKTPEQIETILRSVDNKLKEKEQQ
ncbi:MAG: hypothetical protein QXO69_01460 [archaeon]